MKNICSEFIEKIWFVENHTSKMNNLFGPRESYGGSLVPLNMYISFSFEHYYYARIISHFGTFPFSFTSVININKGSYCVCYMVFMYMPFCPEKNMHTWIIFTALQLGASRDVDVNVDVDVDDDDGFSVWLRSADEWWR